MRINKTYGFTLIELGLVLVVLSLLAAGVLSIATQNIRVAKKKELDMKMDAIEQAVINYRKAHGFIPCPGDIRLVETDQNYGFQAVNAGSCQDGTGAALSPDVDGSFVSSNTVGGMVPVRTLGLSDDYARDPWGGKFLYVVDKRATSASTFSVAKLTDTSLIGSITVRNSSGSNITTTAVMLLLSFGQNGHGAYIGTAQKFMGSTNSHEQDNCSCTDSAAGIFDNVFYSEPYSTTSSGALTGFDDIVRYYSRSQLYAISDIRTEK